MSNLLKSKTFKVGGLVVALAMMVGVASVATAQTTTTTTTTVTAPAYNYSGVMKVGSKGPGVSTLQAALNSVQTMQVVVDGSFGPATKAAVVAFQAAHGLTADGIVGPMTGAKLAAATVGVITVPGGFPAGCTSATGFSTTTGQPCNTGTTLPAGCTSTAGYSPTTGVKCSTGGSTPGSVEGGAGDISLESKSTYSSEDVIAGDEDAEVMAFEVEADDGSDVDITSVKVEFKQTAAGNSDNIEDYIESVSIWMGSTKVGEADADEFTENADFWSKSIALDGAIVDAGETEDFTVAVTALNNLDSGDIDDDAWDVDLLNVRFTDGEGVTTTETADAAGSAGAGSYDQTFDFDDLATSGDLELNLTVGANSPEAGSIEVDDASDTEVTMLEFKLKAEGSDMVIDSMLLAGVATGVNNTWADMVSDLSLEADGDEIDSVSAYYDNTDDASGDLLFSDLDFTIEEDDTITFKVVAKIKEIGTGSGDANAFDQGDTFTVNFSSTNFKDVTGTDQTDVEDSNGDVVVAGDRTGSAVGEAQMFYSTGVAVDMGSVTYESITDSGNTTQVTYNIPLTVTAFGDTRYVGLSAEYEADAGAVNDDLALAFELQDSTAPSTGLENGTVSSTFTCSATVEGGTAYRLDEGDAVSCTLQVIHTTPGTASRSYRVQVNEFQTYTDAALNTAELIQTLTPIEDFQTGYKFITS